MKHLDDFPRKQETGDSNEQRRKLDRVLQFGTLEDLRNLFDGGIDINQTDFGGRTALHIMSATGNKEAVEMLLDRGADINKVFMYQGRIPFTALDAAKHNKQAEIENILIGKGAKLGSEI